MIKPIRIIPRLDIKGPNLVKGIHLEGLRVLGRPSDYAKSYYEEGADELLFMDIVASLYERNSLHDIISATAKSIFIPIAVGGGIRTLEDIRSILRVGADKVIINTAATKDPNFIKRAAREFGSSTIVLSIEAIKNEEGQYFSFIDNGREQTSLEVKEWAMRVEELGCGEIIVTSVDREGTGKGFDRQLTSIVSSSVSVPVVAHGGAGKVEDLEEIFKSKIVSAVSLSSILHYDKLEMFKNNLNQDGEGNFNFLNSGRSLKNLTTISLSELKKRLREKDIICR